MEYDKLFEPGKINGLEIKNRTVMNAMGTLGFSDSRGIPSKAWGDYYIARAKGGVGLIITGIHPVSNHHEVLIDTNLPHMYQDPEGYILSTRMAIEAIHAHGAKIWCQITAGWGRSAIPSVTRKSVAPSAQPNRFKPDMIVPEISKEDINKLVEAFGASARTAMRAGYDGVEVHAVHEGYLLDQFTMNFYNKRTDEYGGSFENRYRIVKEIIDTIRSECGESFPVSLRYSSKAMMKGFGQGILPQEVETAEEVGRDLDEGIKAAKYMEEIGYDALNVDVGTFDSWYWNHPPMYFEKGGMYMDYTRPVSDAVDIPVIMSGRMDIPGPELAVKALEEGYCDFVAYARPLLADEDLVNKIAAGRLDDIRHCLSCHDGCLAKQAGIGRIACAVNPRVGREGEVIAPALQANKVLIIGGGPAGMEAARIAAMRGHDVTLCEERDELGGNLVSASKPRFKHDDKLLIDWYAKQLSDLEVDVQLNTTMTGDEAVIKEADFVIVATGSVPLAVDFPAAPDAIEVAMAEDVLMDAGKAKDSVAIVGAGLVGSELALHLAQNDHQVTVVDMTDDIVGGPHGVCPANYFMLKELFAYHGVKQQLKSVLKQINKDGVTVETESGDVDIPTDQVIIAIGYKKYGDLAERLYREYPGKVVNIGDSKAIKTIMNAVYEGYEVARKI